MKNRILGELDELASHIKISVINTSMDAMEGRLTAPPEIGCSHGSSSSKAYDKDDGSSASGTSSPGRSNSSSNSSSASEDSLRRCSVSREDCNSSPDTGGGMY